MIYYLYKTINNSDAAYAVKDNDITISFIFDPDNTDYQAYLKWISEGNTPEAAE